MCKFFIFVNSHHRRQKKKKYGTSYFGWKIDLLYTEKKSKATATTMDMKLTKKIIDHDFLSLFYSHSHDERLYIFLFS